MNNNQNKDNDKLDMQSPDLVNQNIEKLAELFPNCVTESTNGKAIDFDLLKQELNHAVIEGNKERYRLEWPGKREAIVTANLPITKTLRPVREDSVDFDNTGNIYIEGDNLEVLKLLQESYLGKIKMIYIDPPYNTGNDFVYKDNFTNDKDEELFESGQKDDLSQRLVVNPETSGRYHSDWLSMLYSRLKISRNLLKDDGVIFISIDDNEISNLRKMCDEIFGEENFVAQITWRRQDGQTNIGNFARVKEYILAFGKSKYVKLGRLPLSDKAKKDYQYQDEKGFYGRGRLREPVRGRYNYELASPQGTIATGPWLISKEEFNKLEREGLVHWPESGGSPRKKIYLSEMLEKGQIPNDFWGLEFGTNQRASVEQEVLFNQRLFDFPKPVSLLFYLTSIGSTNSDDIVLDFFSGSATSAHAVMQLNSEDGSKRKFIMVQLPETTDEKSNSCKAGFKNICEIGKERIRRAAKKIKEETGADIDYGFRVYRLDESNMQDVYYRPQDFDQAKMDLFGDNVKPGRTEDDLLAQVMLDWGLPLSLKIEQANVAGKKVFKVAENSLFACFGRDIDEAFAKEIAKEKPLRIVFKDAGFKDDTAKTNVKQLLKQLSPETEMKVL